MRKADKKRKTSETDIQIKLNLDGSGKSKVKTGIPFFDHMLTLWAKHGLFDLVLSAKGDIEVDAHHTVEDIGIVLGEAFKTALGNKKSIRRYGFFILPMDEALTTVVVDISGRANLVFDAKLSRSKTGEFDSDLVEEFFKAFTGNAGVSMHVILQRKGNMHHEVEAIFKAFARALGMAVQKDSRISGVPSTKGVI
jgi:imidazoleglycerol-phosphate dehydratase